MYNRIVQLKVGEPLMTRDTQVSLVSTIGLDQHTVTQKVLIPLRTKGLSNSVLVPFTVSLSVIQQSIVHKQQQQCVYLNKCHPP